MKQTEIIWPKKNAAFLVIHGGGCHNPYEVLDQFARNFLDALEKKNRDALEEKDKKRRTSHANMRCGVIMIGWRVTLLHIFMTDKECQG